MFGICIQATNQQQKNMSRIHATPMWGKWNSTPIHICATCLALLPYALHPIRGVSGLGPSGTPIRPALGSLVALKRDYASYNAQGFTLTHATPHIDDQSSLHPPTEHQYKHLVIPKGVLFYPPLLQEDFHAFTSPNTQGVPGLGQTNIQILITRFR